MKRRHFLQSLTAAATLPALPGGLFAKAAPLAGASTLDQPYLWASFVSRVHNSCSPAKLQRLLKLDETTAQTVYSELIRNRVITPPDAYGLSRAVNPYPQATMLSSAPKPLPDAARAQTTASHSGETATQPHGKPPQPGPDSQSVNQEVSALQDDTTDPRTRPGTPVPEQSTDHQPEPEPELEPKPDRNAQPEPGGTA